MVSYVTKLIGGLFESVVYDKSVWAMSCVWPGDADVVVLDVYDNAAQTESAADACRLHDDPDAPDYEAQYGEVIDDQYRIEGELGAGAYSKVWLCGCSAGRVALKLQKSGAGYNEAALSEITILEAIKRQDPANRSGVILLLDSFSLETPHGEHLGMVLELMSTNLLDSIGHGLSLASVKNIARSLLETLEFVHDVVGVLHLDVKPENVLVQANGNPKLTDFGTSTFVEQQAATLVQTREYRCPEAVLSLFPYAPQADVWSLGCLVFECVTGQQLFTPEPGEDFTDDEAHLAQIVEVLGPIPRSMALRGPRCWFDDDCTALRNVSATPPSDDAIASILSLDFRLPRDDAAQLAAFLYPLLKYNPSDRVSAKQARSLPWLRSA